MSAVAELQERSDSGNPQVEGLERGALEQQKGVRNSLGTDSQVDDLESMGVAWKPVVL